MRTVRPDKLEQLVQSILEEIDLPPETASVVSSSLAKSELRGHESHGLIRIPQYVEMIADGAIDPDANPVIECSDGATARVDGREDSDH